MNEYEILNIIGQGAFGNAYLATHLKEQQNYVIKKVELTGKNKQQIQNIYHEVKLLEQFKHVNIVSYRQSIRQGQQLNIVMEFCHGGDLNQLIVEQKQSHGGRKLDEKKIVDWAAQIALAIFYMHDKRILHRDLKTPNIFILDSKAKLGDFGISKVLDQKVDLASTSIGTPYYMSPEQYKHKPYSYKSDIWAFGCILYEMCNQKRPFEAYSLNGLAVKVLEANFPPVSQNYSRELRDLINRMLQKKEKQRPSILQFIQTPIIKKRVTVYLRETYSQLLKEQGDKVLIEGVQYQAKKLGINLAQKKEAESQKKSKPDFSAEKKRQEKERIKQHLEEQLKKMSEKTRQQKQQLRQQLNQRKKTTDRSNISNRKSTNSISTKVSKEALSQHKQSHGPNKNKQFEIKEKYDMYDMEFEEEGDSEDEVIHEVQEEEEKQMHPAKEPVRAEQKQQKKEEKQQKKEPLIQQIKEIEEKKQEKICEKKQEKRDEERREEAAADSRGYSKQKYIKGMQAARFSQLAPENPSKVETPIEQAILNLKESIKDNMKRINNITNQISAIDFSISSSSEDQLEKRVQKPEQLPSMRKKELNPVHVALTDKANDLKQTLQEILPKHVLSQLLELAKAKGSQVNRNQLQQVVGRQKGAYHLAHELVKLKSMLERIPLYAS